MELFPLWNVSNIARSRIINRMNPAEVIELVIRYKPFRDFLAVYKLPAVDLEWNCYKKQTVLLKFPSLENRVQFEVQKKKKKNSIKTDLEALQNVARSREGFVIGNCKKVERSVEALEEVIKLISKIAHVKNYKLEYHHDPKVDILNSCVFQLTKTFSHLTLISLKNTERMKLTEHQIRYLLDDVKCDHLSLNFDLEGGPRILENIKFNQVSVNLGGCDWLHPRMFLNNSELRSIWAKFTQPYSLEEFIKIVNGWQRGEILQNICHIGINCDIGWPATQGLKIQEDHTVAIVPASGEKFERFRGNITRLTDGKQATLELINSNDSEPFGVFRFSSYLTR